MNAYEQVQSLVDQGEIEITYIDHLPRTISHALARCMFEVYDGYINEPFFSTSNAGTEKGFVGFDDACTKIVNEYARIKTENPDKKPVTILIKDVAKSMPGKYWGEWLALTTNVISLIRDPHLQIYSLMEAVANDNWHRGQTLATQEQVLSEGDRIARTLRAYGTEKINTTSWNPMGEHQAFLASYMAEHPEKRHIIMDGNMVLMQPEIAVKQMMDTIGNPAFKPEMLADWGKSANGLPNDRDWGRSKINVDGRTQNSWTNNAFSQSGFKPAGNRAVPLSKFPAMMQEHLLEVSLPVYLDMLQHPNSIAPRTMRDMMEMLNMQVNLDGESFMDVSPTSAYCFIATLNDEDLSHSDVVIKSRELDSIKDKHPEHSTFFEAVDEYLRGRYERKPQSIEVRT
ncbi:MAG: hypothetical protein ACOYJ2_08720 [Rickettsiales bacterium]